MGRALASQSGPMVLGILGVLSVGLADAFFLARAGDAALAAIGFVFPVITALTSLSIGLSAGTNAVISQAIGRGDGRASRDRLTLHAMALACGLACALALLFWLGAPWLFGAMGAEGAVLDAVLGYLKFWCFSFPFLVTGMALNASFRARGRSSVAATVMTLQALVNIALDPLFIFGAGMIPAMGAEGAGLATLSARAMAFAGVLSYGIWRGVVRLDCAPLEGVARSVVRIGRVGGPAALSNAINPAGMSVVTAAVAVIGNDAVAGFGAASRVQALMLVPMLALSSGIGPVVGQAWGAQRQERAQAAVRLTFLTCLVLGLGMAILLTFLAEPIARIMTAASGQGAGGAAPYTAQYLRVASWGFFGYGILVTANAAMNARDRALWSMGLSAARILLVYIPLTWTGVMLAGYGGILAATLAANLLAAWAALIAARAVGLLALDSAVVRVPAEWLAGRAGGGAIDRAAPLG